MSGSQQRREGLLGTLRHIICRLLCCDEPSQPPPPPKRRLRTFEPGQVAILAEYPPQLELTPREIIDRATAKLTQLDFYRREKVQFAPERVVVLRGRQLTLATVYGDVPAARQDPARLLRFITQLHRTIKKPPLQGRPTDTVPGQGPGDTPKQGGEYLPGSTPPVAGAAQFAAASAPAPAARALAPDADGFDLRAASPNWFANGTPHIIGGGPSGWPVAASGAPTATAPQPWVFNLPPDLQPVGENPVEIAILDTAPRMVDLKFAYDTWVGNSITPPSQTANPLLKTLLSSPADGSFNVRDCSLTPDTVGAPDQLDVIYLPNAVPVILDEHPYQMTSHGLFIAGIIRTIAPLAKLRLIQVLDDEGGGSVFSITQGLAMANHPSRSAPLVINCSFSLRAPRAGDPPDAQDLENVPQADIDDLTQLLGDQFALTNQSLDLAIVAAAGNNAGGTAAPPARYPAAFQLVAGVAALNQDDSNTNTPPQLTNYTDQADDQLSEGFAAFGGERSIADPSMTDAQKGMLGVFIEPLPRFDSVSNSVITDPNTSGWARWAGTSFAAPIVSAVAANLISSGTNAEFVISGLETVLTNLGAGKNVPAEQPLP